MTLQNNRSFISLIAWIIPSFIILIDLAFHISSTKVSNQMISVAKFHHCFSKLYVRQVFVTINQLCHWKVRCNTIRLESNDLLITINLFRPLKYHFHITVSITIDIYSFNSIISKKVRSDWKFCFIVYEAIFINIIHHTSWMYNDPL